MQNNETVALAELQARLAEAEAALAALSRGDADAIVGNTGIVSLRGAEKPYLTFFEAMNEGGLTLDAAGRVLHCNPRFAAMMEASVAQLRGRLLLDLVVPHERPRVAELLAGSAGCASEVDLVATFGTLRPVLLSLTTIAATSASVDNPRMICVVVTDLRKQRAAAAALQESETKYRLLAENSAECIFWIGTDKRYKYVSPAALSLFGFAPEAFMADPELRDFP